MWQLKKMKDEKKIHFSATSANLLSHMSQEVILKKKIFTRMKSKILQARKPEMTCITGGKHY